MINNIIMINNDNVNDNNHNIITIKIVIDTNFFPGHSRYRVNT